MTDAPIPPITPAEVELLDATPAYDGYLNVTAYRLRHARFAGGLADPIRREVVERDETAAVLPYDPARDEVVLIEQFRPGAWASDTARREADNRGAWLHEIVAGVVEEDERPDAVVRREAMEEAGLIIGDLVPVAGIYLTPGICTEFCHIFCGRCDTSGAGGLFGHPDEGEDIRATVHPADQLAALLADGQLRNAITVVGAQWLLLNRDMLRARWT